jgi:Tfp pilus assembly protein PilE
MNSRAASDFVTLLLWLVVIIAAWRIYGGAVRPLLKNRRLARRGFRPPNYSRERRGFGFFGLSLLKWVPALAVVAILAAIAIPAYQDYVSRAQDLRRQADLGYIQMGLSAYYVRHAAYPVAAAQNTDAAGFAAALAELRSEGYVSDLPSDPKGGTYYYRSTANGSFYCLGAKLERNPPASSCDTARLGGTLLGSNYAIGP